MSVNTVFQDIATAIRTKTGITGNIYPAQMATAILTKSLDGAPTTVTNPTISDLESIFTEIADAIRDKTSTTDKISPINMAAKIGEISYGPALISFTIDGTSYQAEESMTWAEWVASSYNTGGFVIDSYGKYIVNSSNRYVSKLNHTELVSDIITANESYSTSDVVEKDG